jgi:hypothetical protein
MSYTLQCHTLDILCVLCQCHQRNNAAFAFFAVRIFYRKVRKEKRANDDGLQYSIKSIISQIPSRCHTLFEKSFFRVPSPTRFG